VITLLLFLATNVVENGIKPSNPMKLKLVSELVLGEDEDDDKQQFTMGSQIAPDGSGNLYVLDPGNDRVVVFDEKGAFLREFGRKGEGPGELQQPKEICLDHEGNLAIFDLGSKKMNTFDTEGKFLREKAIPQSLVSLSHPAFMKNGNILLSVVRVDPDGTQNFELILYDQNFNTLKTLDSIPQPKKDWNKIGEPQFWVGFLKDIFEGIEKGIPVGASTNGETFTSIRSNAYQATIYDQNGVEQLKYQKKFKPLPFTSDAKEVAYGKIWQSLCNNPFLNNNMPRPIFQKALEQAEVGEVTRPIWEITTMGELTVFLVNYNSTKSEGTLDFFNASGKCVAQLAYKGTDEFLTGVGNHLYAMGTDENDSLVVTRYRIDGLSPKALKPASH